MYRKYRLSSNQYFCTPTFVFILFLTILYLTVVYIYILQNTKMNIIVPHYISSPPFYTD